MTVLVLGGTGEARRVAAALVARGEAVVSSLAGAVAAPVPPPGAVRIGGFGGVDGLVAWLREHRPGAVVDATHPFAATITAHAVAACALTGVPLLVLRRSGWVAGPGDTWRRVPSAGAAAGLLDADPPATRVFLATGRRDLPVFAPVAAWFLLRAVDPPPPPLPLRHHLVLARGPFPVAGELALLDTHRVDVVVTRDSGGDDAKLVAARERGLPVLMIDRPPAPAAPTAATVPGALAWLDALR